MSQKRAIEKIFHTLMTVMERKRFGFEVDRSSNTLTYSGYKFHFTVCSRERRIPGLLHMQDFLVIGVSHDDPTTYRMPFYMEEFPAREMAKIRKIALVIATKIKHKPIHDIMSS